MSLRPSARAHAGALLSTLAVGAVLAGCGSDGSPRGAATTGTTTPPAAAAPRAATPGGVPPGHGRRGALPALSDVPRQADGVADPAARRVAEEWFARVRRGDDAGAAALMVDGTRYVNGDIAVLRDRGARVAAAASLPCGAQPIETGGAAGGYVVLSMRLTAKAGAGPCDGDGAAVSVAIHVRPVRGAIRIDDWVRVDTGSAAPAGTPV